MQIRRGARSSCCRRSSASTPHIRAVADGYAAAGYLAIAPATFDRIERDVQLGYTPDDMTRGSRLKAAVEALPAPGVLQDIQAAVDHVARAGKVGIVGYCWGGLLVWRSAEKYAACRRRSPTTAAA